MTHHDPLRWPGNSAHRTAADWVARRDRGLTAAEQDEYLQWLHEDAQRGPMVARHEATLRRMKGLAQWQPILSQETNPDLFAPRRHRIRRALPVLAAAAVAVGIFFLRPSPPVPIARETLSNHYLRVNDRQALADGSIVELRDGSHIEVNFTAAERRVRLTGGEAHFTVAKNPHRPFIVEAGGVAVRAIGTAFNVRLDAATVEVLVTEGRVHVDSDLPANATSPAITVTPMVVGASQRTVVPLSAAAAAVAKVAIVSVTPAQVREVLAWQAPRLQFHETPLGEAVAEFNRHNLHHLVIGDPELGAIPIGGTFRVDNVDGFVRLLEVTLGIHGESRSANETVLQRAP